MATLKFPSALTLTTPSDDRKKGVDYVFYLNEKQPMPKPTYYKELIHSAHTKVCIWDPYFREKDTEIFQYLSKPIYVEVLTIEHSSKHNKTFLDTHIAETRKYINSTIKGKCNFAFGYIDTSKHAKHEWQFHDRFLIIDNSRYFLVGASLASQLEIKKSTGIYEVKNYDDMKIINDAYDDTMKICKRDGTFKTEAI